MPRDVDALKIRKWAESGDVATPESQGLDRATGWPASYSQPGGSLPKREVLNQLFREPSALGVELNTHGLLEWHSAVSYVHPAVVMGRDGQVYVSVATSTGVDPVTDTTNASWKLLALQGPAGEMGPVGPTSGITFEALDSNGDVGIGAGQVAQGDHTHAISNSGWIVSTSPGSLTFSSSWATLASVSITPSVGETILVYGIAPILSISGGPDFEWRIRRGTDTISSTSISNAPNTAQLIPRTALEVATGSSSITYIYEWRASSGNTGFVTVRHRSLTAIRLTF